MDRYLWGAKTNFIYISPSLTLAHDRSTGRLRSFSVTENSTIQLHQMEQLLPLCSDILSVERSQWRTVTQGMCFFILFVRWEHKTRRFSEKNFSKTDKEKTETLKKKKPTMLLVHRGGHAHWAAPGSGVKEGSRLFYLLRLLFCLFFLPKLQREHVPFFPFPCFNEAKILIAPDRNLPEWNALLQ